MSLLCFNRIIDMLFYCTISSYHINFLLSGTSQKVGADSVIFNSSLLTGTFPVNNFSLTETVPVTKSLLTRTVTVPVNANSNVLYWFCSSYQNRLPCFTHCAKISWATMGQPNCFCRFHRTGGNSMCPWVGYLE